MKRITIILEEDIYDRLPVKGKSPFINLVLKNHFRKDSAEEFYQYLKGRLEREGLLNGGDVSWNSVGLVKRCVHNNIVGQCMSKNAELEGCNAKTK